MCNPCFKFGSGGLDLLVKNDSYTGHDAGIKENYIELVPVLKVELYSYGGLS
jgi:hypothetical protein